MRRTALVMTSGGARGAYQAGVLKKLSELAGRRRSIPFQILVGASAGAVNCTALAMGAEDFPASVEWLTRLWSYLRPSDVIRTDVISLGGNVVRWLQDLSVGALMGSGHARALLDTTPLKRLLRNQLRSGPIQRAIDRGLIHALAIAGTEMSKGETVLFVQGAPGHATWSRARQTAVSARITPEHVLASAAIPVLFEPIPITIGCDTSWYGDGCLRLFAPLGPAIRLGADRILAIGLRSQTSPPTVPSWQRPTLAQTVGVSLSAIFLDHLDSDVQHLQRINDQLARGELVPRPGPEAMRTVDVLHMAPSVELGAMARQHLHRLPAGLRYLLAGWGTDASNTELASYLLFDRKYTTELVAIGYEDARQRLDELEEFLYRPSRVDSKVPPRSPESQVA